MTRPIRRPARIATRAEPELAAALDRALAAEQRPGANVTMADVVRTLLWEALRAREAPSSDTVAA